MQTVIQPGLIMSSDTGAVFQLGSSESGFSVPQIKNESTNTPWALWGANNLQGMEMATRIEKCGVLNAGIEAKARIAIGKGLRPVFITGIGKNGEEELEFVNDPEIDYWLEMNSTFENSLASIHNLLGYGWTHDRFILDNNRKKIARWQTDDIVKCRLEKISTATGEIENTYIAADWSLMTSADDKKFLKTIPMLEERNEMEDLQERITAGTKIKEFSMIKRGHLNGKHYYSNPLWWSALAWVDFVIPVPAMKFAMMTNQITVKYLITIDEKYFQKSDDKWDAYSSEEKQVKFAEKAKEINDHLANNDAAYKSIVTQSYTNVVTGLSQSYITIVAIPDNIKDGKLLVDSGAANKEILFALMMNPAINGANTFGGDYSGGAGSGSDIREAYLVQIMLMEAERQSEARKMNIVKHFNGWAARFPGKNLQFRFPNLILTTLDTGGSTAPVVPGASQNNQPNMGNK